MAATSSNSTVSTTRPGRRRQRSVRVTVAVALMGIATAAVLLALPGQSPLWLSIAAVVALLCGWAAARITYSELAQSRREAAVDRAAQAQAYRSMFVERANEHAEFTTAMTDKLTRRDREIAELTAGVVAAEKRAIDAEGRVQRESRRVAEAQEQVARLQERVEELEVAHAEKADELASWEAATSELFGEGVDLMVWEEKVAAGAPAKSEEKGA